MIRSKNDFSGAGRDLLALEKTTRLLDAFSHSSAIGFGICDRQLRYQSINNVLAASNGIQAEAHIGNTIRDVLGPVAEAIEPAFRRALVTGKVVSREIAGKLPAREGTVHWIANYFPVKSSSSQVQQMGAIAVEVTELRKLEEFFSKVSGDLVRTEDKENVWLARELQDSIKQYFASLTLSLKQLIQHFWDLDKSADEQLAPTIVSLDQRIVAMRERVSAVAGCFPIDREP